MIGDTTTLDTGYGANGLTLTTEATANLRKAGKWGRFIGIVYMCLIAAFILFFIVGGSTFFAMMGLGGPAGGGDGLGAGVFGFFLVIYGLVFAFTFYLMYLLYQFGNKAMAAVDSNDSAALVSSLGSLGRLCKITGILIIIYLAFMGLGLIFGLVGGGLAAFG